MRRLEFDIMKGIGILLVMLGHAHIFYGACELPGWFASAINTFHVPLFFIIAGYFSKLYDGDWKSVIKKYFQRLVVPFLITALIVIAYIALVAIKRMDHILILGVIGSFLLGDPSHVLPDWFGFPYDMGVGPVWFLMALFWAKTVFYFISRARKYACLLGIVLSWIVSLLPITLPFFMMQGLTAVGFVAIGYWIRGHKFPIWAGALCAACFIGVQFAKIPFSPYSAIYSLYPVNVVAALGGTYMTYWVAKGLMKVPMLNTFIAAIGNNTMNILCAHSIDMCCNAVRLLLRLIPVVSAIPWLCVIVEYTITLIAAFIPNIINKYKLLNSNRS